METTFGVPVRVYRSVRFLNENGFPLLIFGGTGMHDLWHHEVSESIDYDLCVGDVYMERNGFGRKFEVVAISESSWESKPRRDYFEKTVDIFARLLLCSPAIANDNCLHCKECSNK